MRRPAEAKARADSKADIIGGGAPGRQGSASWAPSASRMDLDPTLRVTLINKYYPPHVGGIENHVRDLARGLAAREGFEVQAIVANETRALAVERLEGVGVVRLPRMFAYASTPVCPMLPWAMRRAATLNSNAATGAAAERSSRTARNLIHLHFPYPWGEVSWLVNHYSVPTVLTYHSDIVRQERLLSFYKPILRRILQRVDLIIASSPNMVEHSEFLRPLAHKCRVVPLGIEVDRLAPSPAFDARARQLREEHSRNIVLFVGRLVYYKGVDVLVRAMAQVGADLVLVGTGPLEPQLLALGADLGISDRLTFLRYLGDDDLAAWYRAADVLCLPSVARSEAFGLVQLEAHAAGTPVVSTTLPTGVPFVNRHNETGLTVPPGDAEALAAALNSLLQNDQLRRRLGRQALERARRDFSTSQMVARTVEVYQEATAGPRG